MLAWRCLLRPIHVPKYCYNKRCHEKTRATVNQTQSTGHCSKNVDLNNSGEVFLGSDIYIYTHIHISYIYTYIYIYTYANPPWNLPVSFFCVLQWFLLVFVLKAHRLWMLEYDESWCFMCRFNDIFWGYLQRFRLPYCVPKKVKYWQNAHGTVAKCQFWALHWFLQCFCSFLWHTLFFWFCMLSDLAGILYDDSEFWCCAVEWHADKMVGSRSHF